jgi:DNA-binding MarR family transcriptional regulator
MTSELEDRAPWAGPGRALAWLARECVRTLASVDLSPPQYRVLTLLAGGQSMSSMLAARLSVSPPSVTTLVDSLVVRGLVERRHSEDDRRRVALTLTEAGSELLAHADGELEAMLTEVSDHLVDRRARRAIEDLELWGDALAARHSAGKGSKAAEQQMNPSTR